MTRRRAGGARGTGRRAPPRAAHTRVRVAELTFEQLQNRLCELAPALTVRSLEPEERTIVVVHSLWMEIPDHITPVLPAYEERFLCLVLILLRQPRTHVVYVTSQPILPRLVDYWLRLVPRVEAEHLRERLHVVSVVDPRPKPLTAKLLDHPRLLERIKAQIVGHERSLIIPFNVSPLERELAVRLGIPVYGPRPELAWAGTKSGGRRIFADEGVPHPIGIEDVSSEDDVVAAIGEILRRRPECRQVMVKVNDGVSGLGNGLITIGPGGEVRARAIALEDPDLSAEQFYGFMAERGGIVEERIAGEAFCSPSAQLRVMPNGTVEVLSTHDQILGGPHGQTYMGCRLPADPAYAVAIGREARKVGERLSREGMIGRFAVDFVAVRANGALGRARGRDQPPQRRHDASRAHAAGADRRRVRRARGVFVAGDGQEKHYVATDDLESEAYKTLTPGRRARHRRGRAHRLGRREPDRRRAAHGQRDRRRRPHRPDRDRRLARAGEHAVPAREERLRRADRRRVTGPGRSAISSPGRSAPTS